MHVRSALSMAHSQSVYLPIVVGIRPKLRICGTRTLRGGSVHRGDVGAGNLCFVEWGALTAQEIPGIVSLSHAFVEALHYRAQSSAFCANRGIDVHVVTIVRITAILVVGATPGLLHAIVIQKDRVQSATRHPN